MEWSTEPSVPSGRMRAPHAGAPSIVGTETAQLLTDEATEQLQEQDSGCSTTQHGRLSGKGD